MHYHRRDLLLGALSAPLLPLALPLQDQHGLGGAPVPDFRRFPLDSLKSQLAASGKPWLPFFTVPSLRCGLYALGKGDVDTQSPHEEDEIYFILAGRASF